MNRRRAIAIAGSVTASAAGGALALAANVGLLGFGRADVSSLGDLEASQQIELAVDEPTTTGPDVTLPAPAEPTTTLPPEVIVEYEDVYIRDEPAVLPSEPMSTPPEPSSTTEPSAEPVVPTTTVPAATPEPALLATTDDDADVGEHDDRDADEHEERDVHDGDEDDD